jgi:adenylyltransferase/sulfurtransferase
VDLPGFGRSRPPAGFDFTPAAHADALLCFLAGRNEPVHLLGNSFGGAIALSVAARRPELVRTLTLVSPAMPDRRPDPRRMADVRLALALIPGRIGDRARAGLAAIPPRVRAEQVVQVCFGDPTRVPEHRLVEAAEDIAFRSGLAWAQEAGERTARGLVASWWWGASPWATAARVQAPTLVVWGERDRLSRRGWPCARRPRSPGRGCSCCPASGTSPRSRRLTRWPGPSPRCGTGRQRAPPGKMAPGPDVEGTRTDVDRGVPMALPPLVEPAAELSKDEVERYSRHLIIPDVGMAGQKRLKNAKVLVVGAGGLGSPALLYLAAAGVGTLGIVEFDVVDSSNLQRQIIHGQSDVGRSKAESARDSIKETNPFVEVRLHEVRLDSSNVLDIFRDYDLILDGTDNFATRYLVNDAAVLLGKPYVWGSIFRFEGQASVFWEDAPNGQGLNYRDLYPEPPPPGMVPSCAEGGVLGVLCASIGSIMVNEAIKLITGIGEPLLGRLMVYDALEMTYRTVRIRKDPSTPKITELIDYDVFCGVVSDEAQDAAAGHTITAIELKEMIDAGKDFALIDVREQNEYEIVNIPGATLIPKGRIVSGEALAEIPQDRPVVLHCKSGQRSAEALAVLHKAGFADAVHVGGGVLAWVKLVDPSQPTY